MSEPAGSALPDERVVGYERLEPAKVTATLDLLHERIDLNLPGRRLGDVVLEVRGVITRIERESSDRAGWTPAVRIGSRVAIFLLVVLLVVLLASAARTGASELGQIRTFDWLSIVDSGVNDVVFVGIAIWFLVSAPDRLRRRRVLATLYRLRSLAHITDMHQMSKDPDSALATGTGDPGGAMTAIELARYYGYCSELLSLTSKAAALCGEGTADAVVLDTVSEIESLTTGMSRKIWQKISLLRADPPPGTPATD